MREEFNVWTPVDVRWNDLDAMRHVNNSKFFVYFEMARMDYFRESGVSEFREERKIGPAVVSATCNFRSQVFFPATLEVGSRITRIGNRSFVIAYEIYHHRTDDLVADGHTTMAWVDYKIGKSIPIPDSLRARIAAFEGIPPHAEQIPAG